ncbi:MAG TPA: hypothetical protein VJG90_03735 [Candidatus Nanoarchaeia archaeon]|nr:hypothetical protein [Candidatus Nanoarchaeia archaeon]
MKNLLSRIQETLAETDEKLRTAFLLSVEQRARGLEQAVQNGNLKKCLIGGAVIGAGLMTYGLINRDEFSTYFGLGVLGMDAMYAAWYACLPRDPKPRDPNDILQQTDKEE